MIYFDNSATTKPSGECIRAMVDAMEKSYANASSLHSAGVHAHKNIENARKAISDSIGCTPQEILLGPGGTYCNNLAIMSAIKAMRRRGNRIVVSSVEHPSVSECMARLKDDGFDVVYCDPRNVQDFETAIDEKTILVSCMYVNNETGLMPPVDKLKKIIDRKKSVALYHIDAVQAFGKLPVNVKKLGCDFLTVSAHKINGPKGIGALYVKKGTRTFPIVYGGEQEGSVIPGTYNSPAAAGFAAAVREISAENFSHFDVLYNYFIDKAAEYDFIVLNTFENQAHHIINISFDGYLGENVLHYLEEYDIFVSQGSACSSHSKQKGRVLQTLGKERRIVDGSLRVSFDKNNTTQEIDEFFKVCAHIPERLIKFHKQG